MLLNSVNQGSCAWKEKYQWPKFVKRQCLAFSKVSRHISTSHLSNGPSDLKQNETSFFDAVLMPFLMMSFSKILSFTQNHPCLGFYDPVLIESGQKSLAQLQDTAKKILAKH